MKVSQTWEYKGTKNTKYKGTEDATEVPASESNFVHPDEDGNPVKVSF